MTGEPLLYAMLAVMAVVHVLAAWYGLQAGRRTGPARGDDHRRDGSPPVEDGQGGGADARADAVECPECGAVNERGYHRCRHCVGRLPGGDGRVLSRRPVRGDALP